MAAKQKSTETVYTAQSPLRHPIQLVRALCSDLLLSRELAWQLLLRDLRAQYRQSLLGYAWILLPALASTVIWVFLNSQGIVRLGETDIPYPAYVLTGLLLWEGFVSSLSAPQTAVNGASSMLTKIGFPREALLLASFGQVLFTTSVRLLLLIGVYVWFRMPLPATFFMAPFGVLILLAFGFAIGIWLVPLGILYHDVGRSLTVIAGLWFFLTPVVYPVPSDWPALLVARINPVAPLLITTRDLLTTGTISQPLDFVLVALFTLLALGLGLVVYRVTMPHLVARMSA